MIGDDLEWPVVIPTKAVLEALTHVNDHPHDDVNATEHFLGALREEIGLSERKARNPH